MANKFPLIVNSSAGQIQEIQGTDDLELPGQLKLTGTAAGGSDINLSGGNDAISVITVTQSSSNLSQLSVDCRNNANNGDVQVAEFKVGASNAPQLNIPGSTASSNKTTGALVVTGGVGIGGNLNVGGDITAFATSDENWKDNLSPITNALTRVGLMTGYTFTWNDKAGTPQWTHLVGKDDTGLIAQDVEKLGLPGITTVRGDGAMAIRYDRLAAILTEAVKELKKENDDLKTLIKNSSSFADLKSSL